MEKFEKFEISNTSIVFGGRVMRTTLSDGFLDLYHCETGKLYNILGREI